MKERLRKTLSILCALMLLVGCLPMAASAEGAETAAAAVIWDDENNQDHIRPSSLTATLTVGGKDYSLTLSPGNNWTAVAQGVAPESAQWSIAAPNGYDMSEAAGSNGVKIFTLKHRSDRIAVKASVSWEDENNVRGVRAQSVKVRLLADGNPCAASAPLNSGNGWTYTWKNLPKYRTDTQEEVVYTVEEADVPAYYAASVSGSQQSGFTVTNTLQTCTVVLNVTVSGLPNGTDCSKLSYALYGPDNRLPKTIGFGDLKGGAYVLEDALPGAYSVQEKNYEDLAEGYTLNAAASKTVDGVKVPAGKTGAMEIKNVYEPRKAAEDLPEGSTNPDLSQLTFVIDGPDETMPLTVFYSSFKNGKYEVPYELKPGTYVVYETNAGTLVQAYELSSDSVTTVAITVDDQGTATAKLVNRYHPVTPAPSASPSPTPNPELVNIPVTKTWKDNNDQDGNRPSVVTIRLYADGVQKDSAALSAGNNWKYTFRDLPRYDANENEIRYTITEDPVDMYDSEIKGYHVTNTYHPEVTSVSVKKIWDDNNNRLRLRPIKIVCTLSNGMTVVLSAANGWSATIDNLPTKLNGKTAVYTWREQQVLAYRMTDYEVKDGVTVFTNSLYVPQTPPGNNKNKRPGIPVLRINDYGTPLGVELIINHVGDCFD